MKAVERIIAGLGGLRTANTAPFSIFFLFACIDAAVSVGILLPLLFAGVDPSSDFGYSPFAWHGRELVFGYASCVCTGFLLTALPRWTGRIPSLTSEAGLLGLWLVARSTVLLPPALAPIIAAPLIALATVTSFHVVAAEDWRDLKVIALLWLSAAGALVATIPATMASAPEFGLRIGIAALIGLVMIIGGRVVRSLTESVLVLRGKTPQMTHSAKVEAFATSTAGVALLVWLIDPDRPLMTITGLLAAATQSLRLAQWRGRQVIGAPSVFILHLAYGFVPLGFALYAIHAWRPDLVPETAARHAWTVGAIGMMTLGIMGSMIRRRTNRSFVTSRVGMAVFMLATGAAIARVGAAFSSMPTRWLGAAATCWIIAFALFMFDFRVPLLKRA